MPRTVQLSDDAYATLAALKRPGESFSDTVKRLASERKDLNALRGLRKIKRIPGYDFDEMDRISKEKERREVEERFGIKLRPPEDD